jgi:hypothetical protein
MTKLPLIPQIININGSDPAYLLMQLVEVDRTLREAVEAIAKAMPHGRDYQTSRTAFAHADAYKAFRERLTVLDTMRSEFMEVALDIDRQRRERESYRASRRDMAAGGPFPIG